jgi:hypothetical protein
MIQVLLCKRQKRRSVVGILATGLCLIANHILKDESIRQFGACRRKKILEQTRRDEKLSLFFGDINQLFDVILVEKEEERDLWSLSSECIHSPPSLDTYNPLLQLGQLFASL